MNNRVSRFVLVGIGNTVIDFSLLNILVFLFHLPTIAANIISSMTAMTVSYILNHGFVFKNETGKSGKQFIQFLCITGFGLLVIQNGLIYLFAHVFTAPADAIYKIVDTILPNKFTQEFIQLNFAKVIATLTTMVWNYQMYKRVIFKHAAKTQETEEN